MPPDILHNVKINLTPCRRTTTSGNDERPADGVSRANVVGDYRDHSRTLVADVSAVNLPHLYHYL